MEMKKTIVIEAQRIFRRKKHGMDFVALELIRELQKIDTHNSYIIAVGPGEDICLTETDNFKIEVLRSTNYINGGTIESNKNHIYSDKPIYFGTNNEGIGVTFIGGLKSFNTLNSLLTEGVGYYDANGNLIEVGDDVKEIVDKGDITIKKLN